MQTALYPPALRDFGVITALNGFLDDFANIYSIEVHREIGISEKDIPEKLKLTLFRLAQEALYNVGKHSRADVVTIALALHDEYLVLEVTDDGIGFDPMEVLRYPDTRLGLGLTSMRERAELLEGTMKIHSTPGKGTTIVCRWNLNDL